MSPREARFFAYFDVAILLYLPFVLVIAAILHLMGFPV